MTFDTLHQLLALGLEKPRSVQTRKAHAQRRQASWSRSGLDRCVHGAHSSFSSLLMLHALSWKRLLAVLLSGHHSKSTSISSTPSIRPLVHPSMHPCIHPSRLLFRHLPHDVRTSVPFPFRPSRFAAPGEAMGHHLRLCLEQVRYSLLDSVRFAWASCPQVQNV